MKTYILIAAAFFTQAVMAQTPGRSAEEELLLKSQGKGSATTISGNSAKGCTDADGNTYKTVKIGAQVWMAENLRTESYTNGDPIKQVTDGSDWSGLTRGAWCYFENNSSNNVPYGKLYNWYTVDDSRGVCPSGWHVPTDDDWGTLFSYLGGIDVAGGKLKTTGTRYWKSPNNDASNSVGFDGIPAGCREPDGGFIMLGEYADWWGSDSQSSDQASDRYLYYSYKNVGVTKDDKNYGMSIRCVKN